MSAIWRGLSPLARFGGHQLIELRVLGEFIGKRYKAGADLDQSVTGVHIGDIGTFVSSLSVPYITALYTNGRSILARP